MPVRLNGWGDILASGNQTSTWSNTADGLSERDTLPFASVHKHGSGFVALICARVAGDTWLEGCSHNTAWLVNLAQFLTDEASSDRQRAGSALKSPESLFLSYAHKDKAMIAGVHRILTREHRVSAWLDQDRLLPGDLLPDHMRAAIHEASCFVLFWSQAAARSEWVRREVEIAQGRDDLTLLVVRLDETPMPDPLANIVRIEAVDLDSGEIAQQLALTIERRRRRMRIDEVRRRARPTS